MKKTIVLGKVDYNNSGVKNNQVDIEYTFDGKRFSASAGVWNARKTDYESCGQMLDEVLSLFPDHELVQRIHKVWKKWHLNDMTAGSPRQEAHLENLNINNYDQAISALTEAGLEPDTEYMHNEQPYHYGTAWLQTELPQSVVDEILSWEN